MTDPQPPRQARAADSRRITVFCGSSPGGDPAYEAAARELGFALARRGLGLVYGGGNVGLMGALADAALAAGAEVIGVIPSALVAREAAHRGLHELVVVDDLFQRKAQMLARGDAFLALPGGTGTLDELFEVLTWNQLGMLARPCAVLDVGGYFAPLLAFLDQAVRAGFLRPDQRAILLEEGTVEAALDRLEAWRPPEAARRRPGSRVGPGIG
jgi:uncharacterized protein (TIGR00730 family)